MASKPQPVRKSSGNSPVPKRASGGGSGPVARVSGDEVTVNPNTAQKVRPRLKPRTEKIQLIGDSTAGKTYAYMRMAHHELVQAKEDGREPRKFYIIDTDDRVGDHLSDGCEFDYLYYENGGNVYPYSALSFEDTRNAIHSILTEVKPGDWIVFDVINKFYDQVQSMVAELYGVNVDDENVRRALTKKGFGGFSGDQWNTVNRVLESNILPIIYHPSSNKLFCSHLTDVQGDAGRERREILTMFDQVGFKPRGVPKLPSWMSTVVFLWAVRKIERDERKRRVSAETARYFTLVKDMGKVGFLNTLFDRDFYEELKDIRKNHEFIPQGNVTDPDEASAMKKAAQDAIEARNEDLTEGVQPTDSDDDSDVAEENPLGADAESGEISDDEDKAYAMLGEHGDGQDS